jgi:hypothetical protein
MVNASERSVQRDIQYLQELGELQVEVQNAPTNRQYKSNLYWVTLPGVTAGVTDCDSGVTENGAGVTAGGVLTLNRTITKTNTYAHLEIEELFNEFWNAYPRKLDKAKAFRAFKSAMKRAKFEDILAGVIAYRNDPARNPEFTKYPATWLNNDAWENAASSSPDSEAAERARIRREREREESQRFLKEQRELEAKSAPAPTCEHGLTLVRCITCSKSLS